MGIGKARVDGKYFRCEEQCMQTPRGETVPLNCQRVAGLAGCGPQGRLEVGTRDLWLLRPGLEAPGICEDF